MSLPQPNILTAKVNKPKNKFTKEEDQLLSEAVQKFGPRGWKKIAGFVPGRTARQCRERWINYLSPEVKTGDWKDEEEELLKSLIKKHGLCWSKIALEFPNRTDVCLKNHWVNICRKEKKLKRMQTQEQIPIKAVTNISNYPVDHPSSQVVAEEEVTPSDEGFYLNFEFGSENIQSYECFGLDEFEWNNDISMSF